MSLELVLYIIAAALLGIAAFLGRNLVLAAACLLVLATFVTPAF